MYNSPDCGIILSHGERSWEANLFFCDQAKPASEKANTMSTLRHRRTLSLSRPLLSSLSPPRFHQLNFDMARNGGRLSHEDIADPVAGKCIRAGILILH